MATRSQLTTVFLVGMLLLSTVAFTAPVAGDEPSGTDALQTLENGEALYLSFGADLDGMTIEEYVEAQASGESDSEIVQYQDVDQVNINAQDNAVSISIDGGEATAVQEANQMNTNDQTAEANATNTVVETHEAAFENVGDVYMILGNGEDQRFDGYAVMGEDAAGDEVSQEAWASVSQDQEVGQLNYNEQSAAFAIAENESNATAIQQTEQYNENLQQGVADASNAYVGDATGVDDSKKDKKDKKDKKGDDGIAADQYANAYAEQAQQVEQANVNEQGAAVAIAVGENSTATAIQLTEQTNVNTQFASADASNVIAQMNGMNMVTAGTDVSDEVVPADTDSNANKKDDKKDDVDQLAEAEVTQYQSVEQANVNFQNAAVAIATNDSEATAVQLSFQENYNVQVGYAGAATVSDASADNYTDVVYTDSESLTVGGNDVQGEPGVSFDYDGSSDQINDVDQYASATVEQAQYATQLNQNEQFAAIAVAEDGGEANAVQVSMQTNENYQFASAESTSELGVIAC